MSHELSRRAGPEMTRAFQCSRPRSFSGEHVKCRATARSISRRKRSPTTRTGIQQGRNDRRALVSVASTFVSVVSRVAPHSLMMRKFIAPFAKPGSLNRVRALGSAKGTVCSRSRQNLPPAPKTISSSRSASRTNPNSRRTSTQGRSKPPRQASGNPESWGRGERPAKGQKRSLRVVPPE